MAESIDTSAAAKQGAAEPTLPGDAAKTAAAGEGAPQGNRPGAEAEGKKDKAPTEGDALVDAAIDGRGSNPPEAQAQDAAGNPVEKMTAERDLHDLDEDAKPDGRGNEPKSYPEPKVHAHVTQDNVSEPGVQTTTEHLKDDAVSTHYGDERDYAGDAAVVDPDAELAGGEPDPGE